MWYCVPSVVRVIWPRFYEKFYEDPAARAGWRRDKWVNLAVSMVHSMVTTTTSVLAVIAVWSQYANSNDWLEVRRAVVSAPVTNF